MTIGTAIVASTKVRATGDRDSSWSPIARFRAVSVGKTASQFIIASWWRLGGGIGGEVASGGLEGVVMGLLVMVGGGYAALAAAALRVAVWMSS